MAEPLRRLTKYDELFVWEAEQQLDFEIMVNTLTTARFLRPFDHEREAIIQMDASVNVSAWGLSLCDDDRVFYPMAYFLKEDILAECKYDIFENEPIEIIITLEEGQPEYEGAVYPLQSMTADKNLLYFMTKKFLN